MNSMKLIIIMALQFWIRKRKRKKRTFQRDDYFEVLYIRESLLIRKVRML